MEESSKENQLKLFNMLRELAELQSTNMRLTSAIFIKKTQMQTKNKVDEFINNLRESAKNFGPKATKLAEDLIEEYEKGKENDENIIHRYKQAIARINEYYDQEAIRIIKIIQKLEQKEMKYMKNEKRLRYERGQIKKDPRHREDQKRKLTLPIKIKMARVKGKYYKAERLENELINIEERSPSENINNIIYTTKRQRVQTRHQIKQWKQELRANEEERYMEIVNAGIDNDKASTSARISNFRKTLGAILNRINGLKRFKNNTIESLNTQLDLLINQKIPEIKQRIENKRKKIKSDVTQKVSEQFEKVTTFKVSMIEKGKRTIDEGKETYRSIIQRGKETKLEMIGRMEESIKTKREQVKQLQYIYDEDKKPLIQYATGIEK